MMMMDGHDVLASLDNEVLLAPMVTLAKSDVEKGFDELLIYFPLAFTGFAIFVFGVQAIASLFKNKRGNSNFE